MKKRILLVDDDVAVTNYFNVFLAQTGQFETTVENDSRNVMDLLMHNQFDLLLLDLDMPNVGGISILNKMKEMNIDIPVIVLTGVYDVDLAVKSMKLGVLDYLVKPVEDDKLLETIDVALKHSTVDKSIKRLPEKLSRQDLVNQAAFESIITQDPEMTRILHQAEKLASCELCVFIWGESGSGKETLARSIHNASARRGNKFVVVEVNSFDPEEFPSFLFGQAQSWGNKGEERQGFIDEANGGTLFLNHIEFLSFPMQIRLRRFIKTGEYYLEGLTTIKKADVRMIVASTKDLASVKYEERFDRDLLYHLMINSIRIPPLRERKNDIMLLASHFLNLEAKKSGKDIRGFSDECVSLLKNYTYPNNIQELQIIIESAVAKEENDIITLESLPDTLKEKTGLGSGRQKEDFEIRKLDELINDHVKKTLEYFGGDKQRSAEELGISIDEINKIIDRMDKDKL